MQRIAVTGSAGFLGSHLVDALLDRGYTVVGIDNLSMGRYQNFEHNLASSRFEFREVDVRDLAALRTACAGAHVIVHLAAYKIPRYGGALETLLVNGKGGEHVLEIGRETGAKILLASTSDVYGKNPKLPFAEGDDSVFGASTVPRWSYAVSKLFEEHLGFAYREAHGVPVVMLRFFGSYGPREHRSWWGGPQAAFIENLLAGKEIEIHGDGQQTRSFTFVSDTVQGIVKSIECDQAVGEVLNIGNDHEITILDLARLVMRLMDCPESRLRFRAYSDIGKGPYEDVRRRVPSLTKSQALLAFSCVVPLEDGIARTIAWHRGAQ
jgi:UDP-glucose 4-epimerase